MISVDGHSLNLQDVMTVAEGATTVKIEPESVKRMARFRALLDRKLARGEVVYGVNTGFGSLSNREVRKENLEELQHNLIRSHSAGVGDPMPIELVRAAMLIRVNSLLIGNSAARPVLAERLVDLLNKGVTPKVPRFGSLGASGDLIPSAHMALTLVGEGQAYYRGRLMESAKALSRAALKPVTLQAKEGLSLINGTCFTTAYCAYVTHKGRRLLRAANSSAALTMEALRACSQSFDANLIGLKRSSGQAHVAGRLRDLLKGSKRIRKDPVPQDPYSIRCVPQVHGALRDALEFAEGIAGNEMNSVSDNPVLLEDGSVLHGGNFHAQPVSMSLDLLSIALSYLGVISLARVNLLLNRTPIEKRFMASRPGLESGLMILQYTATALTADNSTLIYPQSAYPANVSEGVEDHASHGVNAGIKAVKIVENISRILAIELICASNVLSSDDGGVSPTTNRMCDAIRSVSPLLTGDRSFSEEIEKLSSQIISGDLL